MRYSLLFLFFWLGLGFFQAHAQFNSRLNRFEVNKIEDCGTLSVTVRTKINQLSQYWSSLNPNDVRTGNPTFQFNQPGRHYIVQVVQNLEPRFDTLYVRVLNPSTPKFKVQECSGLTVRLEVDPAGDDYPSYTISWGDGRTEQVSRNSPVSNHRYAAAGNYTVRVTGEFGCSTPSQNIAVRSLNPQPLGFSQSEFENGTVSLQWSKPEFEATAYRLYFRAGTGAWTLKTETRDNSFAEAIVNANTNRICYRVSFVDICGNESQPSAEACFDFGGVLIFPNAFAPGSNPPNNVFGPIREVSGDYELQVFNRSGQIIFSTKNPNQKWDGQIGSRPAPAGTYVYRASLILPTGLKSELRGTVTLIR